MRRQIVLMLILAFGLDYHVGFSQQSDTDQIVFLNLQLINAKVFLKDIKVVKGRLKRPKKINFVRDQIYFTARTEVGEKLYEAVIPDPSRITHEYEDDQGRLQSKTIIADSIYFSVRFPLYKTIRKVDFYKVVDVSYKQQKLDMKTENMGTVLVNLKDEGEK